MSAELIEVEVRARRFELSGLLETEILVKRFRNFSAKPKTFCPVPGTGSKNSPGPT